MRVGKRRLFQAGDTTTTRPCCSGLLAHPLPPCLHKRFSCHRITAGGGCEEVRSGAELYDDMWPRALLYCGVRHPITGDKPISAAPVVVLLLRSVALLLLPVTLLLPGCRCSSESITRYSYSDEFIDREGGDFLRVWRPRHWEPLPEKSCPPCDLLFGKLEGNGPSPSMSSPGGGDGRRIQHVEVEERGEPKSGTGFMFEWAMSALSHTCRYLESAFGRGSCRIEWDFFNRTLIFDPRLAAEDRDKPCECEGVERWALIMHGGFCRARAIGHYGRGTQ